MWKIIVIYIFIVVFIQKTHNAQNSQPIEIRKNFQENSDELNLSTSNYIYENIRTNKYEFNSAAASEEKQNKRSFNDVSSWAYQLQNIDIESIVNNNTFDLIVIDYSADGTENNKFTWEQINNIKSSGKYVICYISIGEAENYRSYWNDLWDLNNDGIPDENAPEWLGNENPNWEGNYKVKYWNSDWQNIIFQYVDTIIAQGFDGIYCDIIDAYYYWSEENPVKEDAASLMIDFLWNIENNTNSDNFLIIPQNGEFIAFENGIISEKEDLYFETISAIGVEDVFCPGDLEEDNQFSPDYERIEILNNYLLKGKKIFSVEYIRNESIKNQYISAAYNNGFIPYITFRDLDSLNNGIITSVIGSNRINDYGINLFQNYPNPFNPSTTINYEFPHLAAAFQPAESLVSLKVYDILGREVARLVNEKQTPGFYKINWDAGNYPSGIYFYQLTVENYLQTRKMILLR